MKPDEIDTGEILRYLGYGKNQPSGAEKALIELAAAEYAAWVRERYALFEADISVCGGRVTVFSKDGTALCAFTSNSLARHLQNCTRAVFMAATLCAECDRLLLGAEVTDMAKAAVMQSIGAVCIEYLCDKICRDIENSAKERGFSVTSRFSPGYGDLPLEAQDTFARLTDCRKKIGLTFTESMMMVPAKSVTAIVGLYRK